MEEKLNVGYRSRSEKLSDCVFPKTRQYYDTPKVRGILFSLFFAVVVSFGFANFLLNLFCLAMGLLFHAGVAAFYKETFNDGTVLYFMLIGMIMAVESISWGSVFVAFMGARTKESIWSVLFCAICGRRGGRRTNYVIIRN